MRFMDEYMMVLSLEIDREKERILPCLHTIKSSDTLQEFRRIIACDLITCTEIEVHGKRYDVWSDDEGLLVEKPVPTLYVNDDLILFGNLIFATQDEGITTGLNQEDVLLLLDYIGDQVLPLYLWYNRFKKSRIENQSVAG